MSEEIVINGKSVHTADQEANASSSDYIIVRTTGEPLNKSQKTELKALGVKIQEFVGNESQQLYLCGYEKTSLDKIRSLAFIDYANVYSQNFVVPDTVESVGTRGMVEIDVLLHHDIDEASQDLVEKISEVADVDRSAISSDAGVVRVKVDAEALEKIAALDEVRVIHPVNEHTLFDNVARQILRCDEATVNQAVGRGENQIICVADTGFDMGSTTNVHEAFGNRVKELYAWGRVSVNGTDDPDGHGTHVCGSVLGQGQHNSEGAVVGTAPAASLILQSMFVRFNWQNQSVLGGYPADLGQLLDQGYRAGARVHTNSWGTPLPSTKVQLPYNAGAESIDRYIWNHQDLTVLFAAGNDGQDQDLDGKVNDRSLGAEASAKNCITVGASENLRPNLLCEPNGNFTYGTFWPTKYTQNPLKDDHQANNPEGLAAFSSRGPTAENRLKPDVVGPGTAILSTRSRKKKFVSGINRNGVSNDDRYMYLSGTSMATPLIAGCCAVIREHLLKNGYQDQENGRINPTASLVKALIINGASPIKGQYMPDDIYNQPNPHSGFGRADLAATVAMIEPKDESSGYGIGEIDEETETPFVKRITVPQVNGSSDGRGLTLKVTMAYADLPGGALSNDLNLVVIAGNRERHGNQVDQEFDMGSSELFDRSNNVEQIVWPQIAIDHVQITVKHYRLISSRVQFAYAWRFY